MKVFRKRIFEIIEVDDGASVISRIYDYGMMVAVIVSIIPLFFKTMYEPLIFIEKITVSVFIFDYLLRWFTADYKLKKGKLSFLLYPFSGFAIIDLLSILPSVRVLHSGFKLMRIFRLNKTFKLLKFIRYSKNLNTLINVIKKEKAALITVGGFAIAYVTVSALIIFSIEPDSFNTVFDAFYWAMVTLTTVGYGDIYPITIAGRIVSMLSAFVGIAVVALPTGIISAGYMNEIKKDDNESDKLGEYTKYYGGRSRRK